MNSLAMIGRLGLIVFVVLSMLIWEDVREGRSPAGWWFWPWAVGAAAFVLFGL